MAKFNKPVKHGVIWWTERDCMLIKFNKGEAETSDQDIIDKLQALGYNQTMLFTSENEDDEEAEIEILNNDLEEGIKENMNNTKSKKKSISKGINKK